jgi:riboflavin kinase / FMN adenylyltransferase
VLEISSSELLPHGFDQLAVAIGKFDGIHLGHSALIHELVEFSAEASFVPAVVTFDRHPNATLQPGSVPGRLIGPNQKAALLDSLGIEVVLTLGFDAELANLSPTEFVSQVLVPMRAKMVFIGKNFKFGAGGKGNADVLRELGVQFGFRVREVAHVELAGVKVSSTLIRNQLDLGNVDVAAGLLGRNHSVVGEIEHGRKLGRTLGFPTANFSRTSDGYLPVDGIYAGWLIADGIRYPAAHSVGTNDSIAEVPRLLESHVIGRDDLDLCGKICTAEFVQQVRPWSKFSSLEELIAQIGQDVSRSAEILRMIEA